MVAKVLIWNISFPLKDVGGPAGYLYNLHEYLKTNPCDKIVFLSDLLSDVDLTIGDKIEKNGLWRNIKNVFKIPFILELYTLYCFYFKRYKLPVELDLSDYEFIHFHVIFDLHKYSHIISKIKGNIIVTTHMPEPPFDEIIDNCPHLKVILRPFRSFFIKREISFINRNNAIYLFPTKYSLEPYINSSIDYKSFFELHKNVISYIPTAILDRDVLSYNDGYFAKYGVPDEALTVLYIGRHNSVKGYDELQEIAKKVISLTDRVYFIIAGKEEPLKGLKHNQWIELGWVSKSDEIISNSDLFILPNRQTYFDLILLEVLRAGTPLLVSETGGNKLFINDFPSEERRGVFSYKSGNIDQAVNEILNFDNSNDISLRKSNRLLWSNNFRMKIFIDKYLKLLGYDA